MIYNTFIKGVFIFWTILDMFTVASMFQKSKMVNENCCPKNNSAEASNAQIFIFSSNP
jgi:hypothetical protein